MKIKQILDYIDDSELDFLSAQIEVNHQVKKLTGVIMFKLLLFSNIRTNTLC